MNTEHAQLTGIVHLTDAERDALEAVCYLERNERSKLEWAAFLSDIEPVIDRILAARLALVSALADEWEREASSDHPPAADVEPVSGSPRSETEGTTSPEGKHAAGGSGQSEYNALADAARSLLRTASRQSTHTLTAMVNGRALERLHDALAAIDAYVVSPPVEVRDA